MSTAGDQVAIDQITLAGQIVVGALVVGALIFLGIAASIDLGIRRPIQPIGRADQQAAQQEQKADAKPGADADARGTPSAQAFLDAFVSGPFITYTAIAVAAVLLPLSFLVPGLIAARSRSAIAAGKSAVPPVRGLEPVTPATDSAQLAMVYQQQLIIGAALKEGLAFFAAAAYFVEKSPIALGLALLVVAGLILQTPTRKRVELWIDQQREMLILERQAGA